MAAVIGVKIFSSQPTLTSVFSSLRVLFIAVVFFVFFF